MLALLFLPALWAAAPPPGVDEIVRRSLERDMRNVRALDDYAYEVKNTQRTYDGGGKVTKTEITVEEVLQVDGTRYRRKIEEDGHPLKPTEAKREQDKLDREMARRRAESPSQRKTRIEEEKKKREEFRVLREDVGRAYDFKLMGEDVIQGAKCWRVSAEPKKSGFQGKSDIGRRVVPKMHGTLWISQASYEWLRIEAEALDTIRFGWILASLAKGSSFKMEQARVAGDLWHPSRMEMRMKARGLIITFNMGGDIEFRNFRKFGAESRMLTGTELAPAKPSAPK